MAFGPDIIVTDPESSDVVLVVEVKTSEGNLGSSERQLKRYMAGMRCPVGILATPKRLRLYRDRYLGTSEDSIARVAEFDTKHVLKFKISEDDRRGEYQFVQRIQAWLEGLDSEAGLRELPDDLRRAAQLYIFPAVSQGVVRARRPRPPTNLRAYST
jgi:hypothetical protein